MGVIQNLFGRETTPAITAAKAEIKAQINPAIYDAPYGQYWGNYGMGGYNNFATSY